MKKLDNEANGQERLGYDTAHAPFKHLQEEGARQLGEDLQNLGLRPGSSELASIIHSHPHPATSMLILEADAFAASIQVVPRHWRVACWEGD